MKKNLIKRLESNDYERVKIKNERELLSNFRIQLEKLNNCSFSNEKFNKIILYLEEGSIFDKAKKLRDRFYIKRDEGSFWIKFLNQKNGVNYDK